MSESLMQSNENRLIELETKMSYLENTVEQLQKTVYQQDLSFEKLEANLRSISERYESTINPIGPANQKPPHY